MTIALMMVFKASDPQPNTLTADATVKIASPIAAVLPIIPGLFEQRLF